MKHVHAKFWGYQICRKKFLRTVLTVTLLSVGAFFGMTLFFMSIWMNQEVQMVQKKYLEGEQRIKDVDVLIDDFINKIYENKAVMQDAIDLMYAKNQKEYLDARRESSLSSPYQISYLPNAMKRLFLMKQNKVTGVILRHHDQVKAIWKDSLSGDMKVSFGFEQIPGFGDLCVAEHMIRDSRYVDQTIGSASFYVDSSEIYRYEEDSVHSWNITAEGQVLTECLQNKNSDELLKTALHEKRQYGWLESGRIRNRHYFVRLDSSQSGYTYTTVIDRVDLLKDNSKEVLMILLVLLLLSAGVILTSFFSIQEDSGFLNMIMESLEALEYHQFEKLKKIELPGHHIENEYGMIAVALKDVGLKMENYIEAEYVWKLKEQETAMRALQHQINPHFLYNTLEMIRSKALLENDRVTGDAIGMLGALYRARLHKEQIITLKEEFELLEMYLQIMHLRFEGNFLYQMKLEPEIEEIQTVNFWMQPLAENFFTHGFDRNSEFNLLIIDGYSVDGGVRIDIVDNGKGIAPRKLEQIIKNMHEGNDDPQADIGLRNVYMRLRYFYGEVFRMEIGNNAEGGVFISIFIPGKAGEKCIL